MKRYALQRQVLVSFFGYFSISNRLSNRVHSSGRWDYATATNFEEANSSFQHSIRANQISSIGENNRKARESPSNLSEQFATIF